MKEPVDHALVEQLLSDESMSFREIARRVGCSDWSVRSIARDLAGDDRPMKGSASAPDEPLGWVGWASLAGVAVLLAAGLWVALRGHLPESDPMS